jgi:hypothetical protein
MFRRYHVARKDKEPSFSANMGFRQRPARPVGLRRGLFWR